MVDRDWIGIQKEIGRRIAQERKSYKFTQEELADKVNVSRVSIARMEGGHQLRLRTLFDIADVLSIHVSILIPE